MKRKKILITGPIGDFGGRELEADLIISALMNDHEVSLFSTTYISSNSFAVKHLKPHQWTSAYSFLSKNIFLKFLAKISKHKAKRFEPFQVFIPNKISKKLYDLDDLIVEEIKNRISNSDIIIALVNISSKFLKEIVEISEELSKVCIIRTVGSIKKIKIDNFEFLKKTTVYVHHSEKNAERLNMQIPLPYVIIDQCASNEKELLKLEIDYNKKTLNFGFIGRFTKAKGIMELINFFESEELGENLYLAGKGPLDSAIKNKINSIKNIHLLGSIEPKDISKFYKKIDVLIISSYSETGPLTGIEAMAAGKLILSTNVGAMKERLNDLNSFFYDINDINSFKRQFKNLSRMNNSLKNETAESYRKRYLEKYSDASITKQYKELISTLKFN